MRIECQCGWTGENDGELCAILGDGDLEELTPDQVKEGCAIRAMLIAAFGSMAVRRQEELLLAGVFRRRLAAQDLADARARRELRMGVRFKR